MKVFRAARAVTAATATIIMSASIAMPARADRDHDRAERAIHRDIANIDRDQHKLNDLLRKREDQKYREDYRGMHRTERDIDHVRMDLRRDHDNLSADKRAADAYRRY